MGASHAVERRYDESTTQRIERGARRTRAAIAFRRGKLVHDAARNGRPRERSVAHVAGALGRPVWALLAHAPDWRWLLGRGDTPWYPSMRLFRQPRRGDWDAVVGEVRAAWAALS